jgi:hypothetical protein
MVTMSSFTPIKLDPNAELSGVSEPVAQLLKQAAGAAASCSENDVEDSAHDYHSDQPSYDHSR